MRSVPAAWAAIALMAGAASAVRAQCAASMGGVVPYVVETGDTLGAIAGRYLISLEDWREVLRLNPGIEPNRLRIGSTLQLPAPRLRATALPVTVDHVAGRVEVQERDGAAWEALLAGRILRPGARVRALPGGIASLRLPDGSVSQLSPRTEMRIDAACDGLQGRLRLVSYSLTQGRVETMARPQPSGSRFEVRTPQAVASVRGTAFGVEATEPGPRSAATLSDVLEGRVQLGTARGAAELPEGMGAVADPSAGAPKAVPLLAPPDLSATEADQLERRLRIDARAPEGARRFRYRVARDAQFQAVLAEGAADRLPLEVEAALDDGDYFVALRAEDGAGIPGRPAARPVRLTATPTPPAPLAPAQAHREAGNGVEIRCGDVPDIRRYTIQVSQDPRFGDLAFDLRDLPVCLVQLGGLEPGVWYWRTASHGADSRGSRHLGPWSEVRTFELLASTDAPASAGATPAPAPAAAGGLPAR